MAIVPVAGDVEERRSTLSGLTVAEAREFNTLFVISFLLFVAICVVAHVLTYVWRPWLPSSHGYNTSMLDGAGAAAHALITHLV